MPKIATLGIAALLLLGFSVKTLTRVPDWKNGATLNASAMIYSPNSARANCFYGVSMWEERYLKLPKDATNDQKTALLNEMNPYFERALQILPNYGSALKMWIGIAAERHKIDDNLDPLLAAFERTNHNKTYEPFILEYLKYLNERAATTRTDAEKLARFYTAELAFFKENMPTSIMPQEYQKLLDGVNTRLTTLK